MSTAAISVRRDEEGAGTRRRPNRVPGVLAVLLTEPGQRRQHVIVRPRDSQGAGDRTQRSNVLWHPAFFEPRPLRDLEAGQLGGFGDGEPELLPAGGGVAGEGGSPVSTGGGAVGRCYVR